MDPRTDATISRRDGIDFEDKIMPYKRPGSKIWYAEITDARGQRVRRSTGTTDKREAEELEAKWRSEARRERLFGERPPITFEELAIAYLKQMRDKRSIQRDKDAIKRLRESFAGRNMNQLDAGAINGYKERRARDGMSPGTVNRELAVLSSAINYANRELGHQITNVVTGRKHRGLTHRVRWITREEAMNLIEACRASRNDQLADFVVMGLNTGMRKQEILGLEWSRVDLANRMLYLRPEDTKGKRRLGIPINATVRSVLTARLEERMRSNNPSPWVFHRQGKRIGDITNGFRLACQRAGLDDFHPHDLRHTCAAWLVSAGIPLSEVRDLLGHSSVIVTERYAHLCPGRVRAAVTVLDEVLEGKIRHSSQHAG